MLTVKKSNDNFQHLFPSSNAANVSAALTAGDVFPRSEKRGKCPEVLTSTHGAYGLIAHSINAPLRKIAKSTLLYGGLRSPEGKSAVDVITDNIDVLRLARREVKNGVTDSQALRDGARVLNSLIVIDCNFPSITIAHETKDGTDDKVVFGPIRDRQSQRVRAVKSTTISGHVLLELCKALHGDAA